MADYASTVTKDHARSERISRNFGMIVGKCDVTNYNTTGAEITDITKYFKKTPRVIVDSLSVGGYMLRWNTTDKCFHAFYPTITQATQTTKHLSHAGADIKGSANTESPNTDVGSLPTNGALIVAAVLQSAVTTASGVLTVAASPGMARNLCFCVTNDSGGALNLYEGATTLDVVGVYRGAAQTESITITSTAGNKAVATANFRYTYGSKPFDSVTSITQTAYATDAMAATLKMSVGIGSKLALPTDLKTPAAADVTNITKNAAHLANSGIVDTTNMSVNLGTLADGDDFTIDYLVKGGLSGITAAPGTECASNLTTIGEFNFFAIGLI